MEYTACTSSQQEVDPNSDDLSELSNSSRHCDANLLSGVVKGTIPEGPTGSVVPEQDCFTRIEALGTGHPINKFLGS